MNYGSVGAPTYATNNISDIIVTLNISLVIKLEHFLIKKKIKNKQNKKNS